MKLEWVRKYDLNNLNDCDNHLDIARLFNKIEVLFINDFVSLEEEKFNELRFEILSSVLGMNEDKAVIEKSFYNLSNYSPVYGLKPLSFKFGNGLSLYLLVKG